MANPQTENGYVKIATEILDHLCAMRIPGEVRQVVDVVIRKTYGYKKKEDWISNSQICELTKMKKGNVSRSLSKAITHKLVIKSDNGLALNKNWEDWKPFVKVIKSDNKEIVIKSATKVIKSDNKKLSKVMDTIDNKDNFTKDNTPIPPSINPFQFYTDNIEILKPFSSEVIKDFIHEYGQEKVLEAMQIAVKQNKRSLQYIGGILKNSNGTKKSRIPEKYHTMEELIGNVEPEESEVQG